MAGVTHSDIAHALQEAFEATKDSQRGEGPAGVTTGELAEYLGCAIGTARDKLRKAINAGLAKYAGHAKRINIMGTDSLVPVYAPASEEGDLAGGDAPPSRGP